MRASEPGPPPVVAAAAPSARLARRLRRYAVAVPGGAPGAPGTHARARTVIVHRTDRIGPAGEPVFEDGTGLFSVQIDGAVAEVLTAPGGLALLHPCLEAVPMP
ncbi:DUF6296 family protein [Kitasatospora sp. NPDC054939]